MTMVLSVQGLAKAYADRTLFREVSFQITRGEKVALFGPNGCGKTTLLRMIVGEIEPDAGRLRLGKGLRVGYLPQSGMFDEEETVAAALGEVAGAGAESAREVLLRFGLGDCRPETRVGRLSPGERTRLGLGCLWRLRPDLLLLDEPTNHLDLPGLSWLGEFVRSYPGTVVVVSHDRYFLDQIARRVIELSPSGARSFPGDYSAYRRQKRLEFESQLQLYLEQGREEKRLEERIRQQMEWFRSAHRQADQKDGDKSFRKARAKKAAARAKAVASRLERLRSERVARPREADRISLETAEADKAGRRIVLAEEAGKAFDRELFREASFAILRGERVGIVGPNGCGKTTLLRMILGLEPPSSGRIWLSPAASPYYLDQRLDLDEASTVLEAAADGSALSIGEMRNLLARLRFRGDDVHKRIASLSRGERVRVILARLMFAGHNLLALDEPTNHLDIESREVVEECLAEFDGTLLIISHDRYLLRRLCNRILAFDGRRIRTFPGGYAAYEEWAAGQIRAGEAKPEGPGGAEGAGDELLLRHRLAVLSARLGEPFTDPEEKLAVEREYLQIAGELRILRRP